MNEFDMDGPGGAPGPALLMLILSGGASLIGLALTVWALVDCFRAGREPWWFFVIFFTGGIGALVYLIVHARDDNALARRWVAAARTRRRIAELKARIHHIDNAWHRVELGDVYRERRDWEAARALYEEALAREPGNFEARAHLGYALLELGRPEDALPRLETALAERPEYDYGGLAWRTARCLERLGRRDEARAMYERVLARHSYTEAQLEYAMLLREGGDEARARAMLERIVADAPHAPKFQQRRDRPFVRRARKMLARGA